MTCINQHLIMALRLLLDKFQSSPCQWKLLYLVHDASNAVRMLQALALFTLDD